MAKTGATRYQKFLKSEKAKTKLKSKKDLPKGTNVTKTNFQVKKIVIKEQLKKHGKSEALTTRKLNVKELLSRLTHHNTQAIIDALEGLHELLTVHPETLEKHLSQLIHGISSTLLNIEKKVRCASLKLLHNILSRVGMEKLDPFYNIMSTYLRSGMTHIDSRIQDDSLLFLDTLLVFAPEQVIQDFHKIIPNFLDMISKLRIDSKPGRTLSLNLDNQISTVKWRTKVLHRLQRFFQKYVEYNVKNDNATTQKTLLNFNRSQENYYSLFNTNYTSVCPVSCFSSKCLQEMVLIDEVQKFNDYTDILIPLLYETWVEVCPSTSTEKLVETVVSEDSALLLKHILELLSLIMKLIQHFEKNNPSANIENNFSQKYRKQFNQHFVNFFPFVTNIRSKQCNMSSDVEEYVTDAKLIVENLQICNLFIILNPNINIKNQKKEIVHVLNYIEKTFNHQSQDNVNNAIINILHTIFAKNVSSWTKNLSIMDALLRKIIWAYFNKDMALSFKQLIFALLCRIALNDNLGHFHESDAYEKWLNNLPDILLDRSITPQTIDIIHKFAVRHNATFNTIIKLKLSQIIENLPLVVVTQPCNESDYHKLYSILYHITHYDFDSLNALEIQVLGNAYGYEMGKYVVDILKLRSGTVKRHQF